MIEESILNKLEAEVNIWRSNKTNIKEQIPLSIKESIINLPPHITDKEVSKRLKFRKDYIRQWRKRSNLGSKAPIKLYQTKNPISLGLSISLKSSNGHILEFNGVNELQCSFIMDHFLNGSQI